MLAALLMLTLAVAAPVSAHGHHSAGASAASRCSEFKSAFSHYSSRHSPFIIGLAGCKNWMPPCPSLACGVTMVINQTAMCADDDDDVTNGVSYSQQHQHTGWQLTTCGGGPPSCRPLHC